MGSNFHRPGVDAGLAGYVVPTHLRNGLAEYVIHGREVGGFLGYCLENNFAEAAVRAGGDLDLDDLRAIAKWLFNECPRNAWGSPAAVKAWRGI